MVTKRTDYTAEAVAAARSVMLELTRLLGEYQEGIVIVGGWAGTRHPRHHRAKLVHFARRDRLAHHHIPDRDNQHWRRGRIPRRQYAGGRGKRPKVVGVQR